MATPSQSESYTLSHAPSDLLLKAALISVGGKQPKVTATGESGMVDEMPWSECGGKAWSDPKTQCWHRVSAGSPGESREQSGQMLDFVPGHEHNNTWPRFRWPNLELGQSMESVTGDRSLRNHGSPETEVGSMRGLGRMQSNFPCRSTHLVCVSGPLSETRPWVSTRPGTGVQGTLAAFSRHDHRGRRLPLPLHLSSHKSYHRGQETTTASCEAVL